MNKHLLAFCAVVLWSFSAFAGDGSIRRSQRPVKDQYRVRFVETLTPAQIRSLAAGLAMQHRGVLGYVFDERVPGFVVTLPEPAATAIGRHPLVESVEEVSEVTLSQLQPGAPWHLDRIDQRALPLNGAYWNYCETTRVHAYVLDSGILATHTEFMQDGISRVIAGKDFVNTSTDAGATNPCPGATIYYESTPCKKTVDTFCVNGGHGTAVASVLAGKTYGVSKHVKLISVRVANCFGTLNSAIIEQGLHWIYNDHVTRVKPTGGSYPAVVNMSFEMPIASGSAPTALETMAELLVNERNIVVVVAAGNGDMDVAKVSPARRSRTAGGRLITAGGSTNTDRRWRCNPTNQWEADVCAPGTIRASNHGGLDVFAPSQNIPAAGIKEPEAGTGRCCVDSTTAQRQVARSGTSFAAPAIAGLAAIHLTQDPSRTPDQVWDLIRIQASGNSGGSTPPAVMPTTANDASSADLLTSPNRLLFRQGASRCRSVGF